MMKIIVSGFDLTNKIFKSTTLGQNELNSPFFITLVNFAPHIIIIIITITYFI